MSKSAEHKAATNHDNDWLAPAGLFDFADEVNGTDAEEEEGFTPTREELVTLLKYWTENIVDIEFWWFLYQQVGGSDARQRLYACDRIDRISRLIGEEATKRAVKEAWDEFGAKRDPKTWDIYVNGDKAQRKTLQDEIARKLCGEDQTD